MSSVKIDQDELPEHYSIFTLTQIVISAAGDGALVTMAAPGHHPKCRLVKLDVLTTKANADEIDITIEDGDGTDAAVGTGSPTLGANGTVVYTPNQVFERNEAIVMNVVDAGTTASAFVAATFESID